MSKCHFQRTGQIGENSGPGACVRIHDAPAPRLKFRALAWPKDIIETAVETTRRLPDVGSRDMSPLFLAA
jgi:hypothetical protein